MNGTQQDGFGKAVLDPAQPAPRGLHDGLGQAAGRRFDVYRNNVVLSLREALRIGFPVVTRLIGAQNMDGVAGLFLRAHPPSTPLMMRYGADFPAFLAGTTQLAHLGYLPDIARLELAIRRSYHARDAEPIAPARLADTPAETLMRATITLAPAVQLVRSDWPIHDIWRYNTDKNAPKPRLGAQDVLVTRPDFDPLPQLLPPGGGRWIASLMNGQSIASAYDAVLADAPDFDLTALLSVLLQGKALVSLNEKG